MTNPEFDQGGISTLPIYQDAADFRDMVMSLSDRETYEDARRIVKTALDSINNTSGIIGCELRITSPIHYVDWSFGEALNHSGLVAVQEVMGTFEGQFIGYQFH